MKSEESSFKKVERIVSKKLIDEIFSGNSSQSMAAFPLRIVFMERERPQVSDPSVVVLTSVSKRHFKHAVDRNRVKRQMREAYRLNKQLIIETVPADKQLCLAFIWLSDRLAPSHVIATKTKRLMKSLAEQYQNTQNNQNNQNNQSIQSNQSAQNIQNNQNPQSS